MLEKIMRLYVMYMANDVRSPLPHLFGPPGCGKSTSVEQAAKLLGVNLHIINVARISPLELEGVQMPETHDTEGLRLRLLHATFWTQLKEGDILLLDEFLRGFPEVYNGLLDILTSRQVGGFVLPKVFIIGASNSTVSYDKALEDRLLHLPVADPRKNKTEKKHQAQLIIDALGLMPRMLNSTEMEALLVTEVHPMYEMLDSLKGKSAPGGMLKGCSVRNLIGQGLLREVQSSSLRELIDMNNRFAIADGKAQYVLLLDGKANNLPGYAQAAAKLKPVASKLTEIQAKNLELNLQLIELEEVRSTTQKGTERDDDSDIFANL